MIVKYNQLIFRFALAALTLISSAALAQKPASDTSHVHAAPNAQAPNAEDQARSSLHIRITAVVNAMISRANTEGNEFNKRLTEMNAAAPLETSHLDSAGVAVNVPLVLEFLEYLKRCRASSDSLNQAFNDSLFALNADLPADDADEGLKAIGLSFNEDRTAFSNFLASLDKLYSKVLDALLFLQNTHYTIVKDQVTFNSRTIFAKYSKMLNLVDAANMELSKASKELRKANTQANARVKKASSDSSE